MPRGLTIQRSLCGLALAAGLLFSATTVHAHPHPSADKDHSESAKEQKDSEVSTPVGFRSIGIAFVPHLVVEADMYIAPEWAVGIGATKGGGNREYACSFDRCWWLAGGNAYAERYFFLGDRWAHIGLRAGVFGGRFYSQTFAYGRDGQQITREGTVFGPSLSTTLNVTAFSWGALTLNLTGIPGVFTGTEKLGWPNRTRDDQPRLPTRSDTSFVFTGTAAFGVRFGDLDGRNVDSLSATKQRTHDTR